MSAIFRIRVSSEKNWCPGTLSGKKIALHELDEWLQFFGSGYASGKLRSQARRMAAIFRIRVRFWQIALTSSTDGCNFSDEPPLMSKCQNALHELDEWLQFFG